jgi:hypothetical protein
MAVAEHLLDLTLKKLGIYPLQSTPPGGLQQPVNYTNRH